MLVKKIFYRELVGNAVKILTVLFLILPITELFKQLEQNAANGIPFATLITIMTYGTIASFPQILTIACFLTIVITVNRYCKDHEFIVWLASGVSPFFWLKTVILFALPFALMCGITSMYITPWAASKSHHYVDYLAKQETNLFITPGVFKENDTHNMVFYLDKYLLSNGFAKNIFVQYVSSNNATYNITATDGKIENSKGTLTLILENGKRYQVSGKENESYTSADLAFGELRASIRQTYTLPSSNDNSIDTASINHLLQISNQGNNNASAELSWRFSIGIMMFVMTILVLPLSIQIGRVQNSLVFIFPPLIYAIYNNLILTLNGYINQGRLSSVFIVQGIHLLLIGVAFFITYYKTFPKGSFIKIIISKYTRRKI